MCVCVSPPATKRGLCCARAPLGLLQALLLWVPLLMVMLRRLLHRCAHTVHMARVVPTHAPTSPTPTATMLLPLLHQILLLLR